jgi:hypothetical protein
MISRAVPAAAFLPMNAMAVAKPRKAGILSRKQQGSFIP